MYYKLVMINDNRRGREITLKAGDTIIGRTKGCKIRISAHEISRKHCRIRVNGEQVHVKDLGSANGTRINGNPVTGEYVLQNHDRINVGPVTFMLERKSGPAPVDAIPVDVVEVIEEMTATFPPPVVAAPATLPDIEPVTFIDYPGSKPQQPQPTHVTLPTAVVDEMPFASLDDSPTPPPSSRPAAVTTPAPVPQEEMPFADLDEEPQPASEAPVMEVQVTPVEPPEEELPYADLDAEMAAEPPQKLSDTDEELKWLLSEDKK